ncbi:hypothetical protein ABPG72_017460 [Tetrahymena utriculariae]
MATDPFAVSKKKAYKNPFGIKNPSLRDQTGGIYNPQDGGWGDTDQTIQAEDFPQNGFQADQGTLNNGFGNTFQQSAKPAVPNKINQNNNVKKNPFPAKPQNQANPFALNPNTQAKSQTDSQFDNPSNLDFTFNMEQNTFSPQNSNQQAQIQPKRFDPNQAQQQQQQQQSQLYQQQLGYTNLGFDPNNVDPDNEPPLLVELGVDLNSIKVRTLSVLKFKKCDIQFLEDPDMSGPIILGFVFGFLLLLSGKMQFGYVYGFGISGTVAMYCIMNFLSMHKEIPLYNTLSILGYCLMPVIILSFFNVFISLRFSLGYIFALLSILWSTYAATNFFNELIHQQHQKYLVAYPVFLFYSIFVLLTIF